MTYFTIIVPLIIALAGGIVGLWDKLFDKTNPRKRGMGIAALIVLLGGSGWQAWVTIGKQLRVEALSEFMERQEEVDEASGGTTDGDLAYIVDDEDNAVVHVFRYESRKGKFVGAHTIKLEDPDNKIPPEQKEVKDLEGAAFYNDHLYLVTSHSNSRKGKPKLNRRLFLEVKVNEDATRGVVTNVRNLRQTLENMLLSAPPDGEILANRWVNEPEKNLEVLNIEGLAIDPQGRVYFGLRNPLATGQRAIVFRGRLQDIFEADEEIPFDIFLLKLRVTPQQPQQDNVERMAYGIVAMEYDSQSEQILILGNHPRRHKKLDAALWSWKIPDSDKRRLWEPDMIKRDFFHPPAHIAAKPEVLLVPANKNIVSLFIDAEYIGGQRVYGREELGLH